MPADISSSVATPVSIQTELRRLLNIQHIYYEPDIVNYDRGIELLTQYPDAARTEVASHWNIPQLHGNEGSVDDWNRVKRTVLVLGVKKSISARKNTRSSNWMAPSHANGCAMACAYCYVARRKGYANPITTLAQLKCEVIFLTHNDQLHEVNLGWHPQAESVLWQPNLQEQKQSQTGGHNVRYKYGLKGQLLSQFRALLQAEMPYCTIRYAF